MKSQKGFAPLATIILIVVIIVAAVGGYVVYKNKQMTQAPSVSQVTQGTQTTTATSTSNSNAVDAYTTTSVLSPVNSPDQSILSAKSLGSCKYVEKSGADYVVTQNGVYVVALDDNGNKIVQSVIGADPQTFKNLGIFDAGEGMPVGSGIAKDKNHVYFGCGNVVSGLDAPTFTVVDLTRGYAKDKNGFYSLAGGEYSSAVMKIDFDPTKVVWLEQGYAKDSKNVYFGNKAIAGADSTTFHITSGGIPEDINHVYQNGQPIAGADPASYVVLGSYNKFAKDKNHVYVLYPNGIHIFSIADPATFVVLLGDFFAKDKNHVYVPASDGPEIFSIADPATFVVLDNYFSKDKNNVYVYLNTQVLAGADPGTFQLVTFPGEQQDEVFPPDFAKDKNHVYTYDGKIIPAADPATFQQISANNAVDKTHVYDSQGSIVTGKTPNDMVCNYTTSPATCSIR